MKKVILSLALAFCVFGANAQKIVENNYDKFTKAHIVTTSYEKVVTNKSLVSSMSSGNNKHVWVSVRSVNGTALLGVKWLCNGVLSVLEDAELMLVDDAGNTHTFKCLQTTVSGKGEGTVGLFGSGLYGLNLFYKGDVSALANKKITDMRIYTNDGYFDFPITSNKQDMFSKLYLLYAAEIKK